MLSPSAVPRVVRSVESVPSFMVGSHRQATFGACCGHWVRGVQAASLWQAALPNTTVKRDWPKAVLVCPVVNRLSGLRLAPVRPAPYLGR